MNEVAPPGMARQDIEDVTGRLLSHHRERSTDLAANQWREPVDNYRGQGVFEQERDLVFGAVPLPIALSCQLAEPGRYLALEVAGTPVLLTRDRDGKVRAMVNRCRHRGAELVAGGDGSARRLTCPYHSWSYDLSGCLLGVYGEHTFGAVDRSQRSLIRLPAQERCGVVFVGLRPGMAWDLDAWLAEVAPVLEPLRLDQWYAYGTRTLAGPNWKIAADGYLESYHFRSLHPTTVFQNNFANLAAFDRFGPHQRNVFAHRAIADAADEAPSEWDPVRLLNPVLWLFPCVGIAGGLGDYALMSLVLPGRRVTESITYQTLLWRHRPSEKELPAVRRVSDYFYYLVSKEDYPACGRVQEGLDALAGTDFVFGRNEPGVQHFHRHLDRLRLAGVPPARGRGSRPAVLMSPGE
ncbi:MAG: aromatic ring-hydroxylating dioxygenase subunit alpha [Actinophytocola sp.]|uniref:aromatic ring-hydroxylating oxygenase subunit alpha n=1 Tax=Actinophytocola sp. TaxID=1872138 RepID=UPI003C752D99